MSVCLYDEMRFVSAWQLNTDFITDHGVSEDRKHELDCIFWHIKMPKM